MTGLPPAPPLETRPLPREDAAAASAVVGLEGGGVRSRRQPAGVRPAGISQPSAIRATFESSSDLTTSRVNCAVSLPKYFLLMRWISGSSP